MMRSKFLFCSLVVALVGAFATTPAARAQARRTVTIGIVTDGDSPGTNDFVDAIKRDVSGISSPRFSVEFPDAKRRAGDFNAAKIAKALDALLADDQVDIVLALGPGASNEAGTRKSLAKPVIAPFVIDRELQNMPFDKGKSGRRNFNYLDWPWSLKRDIDLFVEIAGSKNQVLLAEDYLVAAMPKLTERAVALAETQGVALSVAGVSSVDDALKAVPEGTDGVLITGLDNLSSTDRGALVAALNARRIPTFSLSGEAEVEAGVLAGRRPRQAYARIARRVALHTQRILSGEDAGDLSVALQLPEKITINMRTARQIGLSPSWKILTEAELVATERTDIRRRVSLRDVVTEALKGNVNIRSSKFAVRSGKEDVRLARSNLLPSIDANADALLIDSDRARAAFGQAPQLTATGGLRAQQILYSENAWAGYTAEKHAQRAREQSLVQTQWNIATTVSVAFLDVLRTKTAEDINRANLKLTRQNLELARIRVDAGSATEAEVYRWRAQIAVDRRTVIDSSAQRNVAEIGLQRLLHRPPEERFAATSQGLPTRDKGPDNVAEFLNDPMSFRLFREFMVAEAIRRSPEVKQLDAAIAAQERLLVASRRNFFIPTIALAGEVTRRLADSGTGTERLEGSPVVDDTEWFIGLTATLPLYVGSARFAEVQRNHAEIARLKQERDLAADIVAEQAASQLHLAGASFAGIALAQDAAEAAQKNFELLSISYREGAAKAIELLDAQEQALNASLAAANAEFDFLITWVNVQRAIGWLDLLTEKDDRKELLGRALRYIEQRKAALNAP